MVRVSYERCFILPQVAMGQRLPIRRHPESARLSGCSLGPSRTDGAGDNNRARVGLVLSASWRDIV